MTIHTVGSVWKGKPMDKKNVPCPMCGTPCKVVSVRDFDHKGKVCTMHYEPIKPKQKEKTDG